MAFASLSEPLRAANLISGQAHYVVQTLSVDGLRVVSSSGASINTLTIHNKFDFDAVFVVAGGTPLSFNDKSVFGWLRALARRQVTIGGVSGGPAILVNAGVMAGKRMTIHPEHRDALHERHPDLQLERSLFVYDQDRITCGGGIAPMDMMHELISRDLGPAFARVVSDWFLHTETRSATGPQQANLIARYNTRNPTLLVALEAMENNISDPLSLSELAQLAQISPRQLNRGFQIEIGQSTMAMYRHVRLGAARRLLTQTALSVTQVGLATGFANPAHFSAAYRRRFGAAPRLTRTQKRQTNSD